MTFSLDDHWVWDFWLADDGDLFHLFYLHAPKSLGDPELRHRNARIGHATSSDLIDWHDLGVVLTPGASGDFDETATWTGSVVRGDDGVWRMFYTGSSFLFEDATAIIETIGVAVSTDLHDWKKQVGPITRADPRWYETLGSSDWPEEAWRDPWVFHDPAGNGWHMLVTARSNSEAAGGRGVIGHATSPDLDTWTVTEPLSLPGAGFDHLEVPQVVDLGGEFALIFSCDSPRLTGQRAGNVGGIWAVRIPSLTGPYPSEDSHLLADERLYSGKAITNRAGEWVLLAFDNATATGDFLGSVSDPIPFVTPVTERLALSEPAREVVA